MQTEYEGIRTELSDFEQTLQPTKQSDEGHHLEAGRKITGPTSEVSVSQLNLCPACLVHTDVSKDEMSIFEESDVDMS